MLFDLAGQALLENLNTGGKDGEKGGKGGKEDFGKGGFGKGKGTKGKEGLQCTI